MFSKKCQSSETLSPRPDGVTGADGDGWIDLFFFFAGCLSLNAGAGPSTTDNVYFVMRRVRGACEAV